MVAAFLGYPIFLKNGIVRNSLVQILLGFVGDQSEREISLPLCC